jgi:hypothetical protein
VGWPPTAASASHRTSLARGGPNFPTRDGAYHPGMRPVDWILRAEALTLFVAGVALYLQLGGEPWWLLVLLLVPDVSMLGYLGGPRLGAVTYNLVHNLVIGLGALAIGWVSALPLVALGGAILIAHVGMDRTLGYGLKLPTDFRDTHLGRIGRER